MGDMLQLVVVTDQRRLNFMLDGVTFDVYGAILKDNDKLKHIDILPHNSHTDA